ncbi:MAG: sugar phosphate isomerase/epimerase [Peptostreptococcaceae bacterium]|jgi:sugar phosphate isomerase/epimerase|nr:sugar phosphate isomerase/epimerase [Peptostreptococcaceae bacterium]
MKIGYAASVFETNILDSLKYANDNGFNSVELNMNMICFFPENNKDIKKIIEFKEANNMTISFHAPEDISLINFHKIINDSGLKRLKEIIDFANKLDVYSITIHTGSTPYFTGIDKNYYVQEQYKEEARLLLRKNILELINYNKNNKVKLCIENSGYFSEIIIQEVLQEIINEGHELYLTYDIGHAHLNKYNEKEFFKKNISKIKTLHLHDYKDKDHKIIGTGYIDFREELESLDKDLLYIIEVRPKEAAKESLDNLKKIL